MNIILHLISKLPSSVNKSNIIASTILIYTKVINRKLKNCKMKDEELFVFESMQIQDRGECI